MEDQRNHGGDQQEMNQANGYVERDKTQDPRDQQNEEQSKQHLLRTPAISMASGSPKDDPKQNPSLVLCLTAVRGATIAQSIVGMSGVVEIVGKSHTVQLFGIPLIGVSGENAKKLLFTVVFIVLVLLIGRVLRLMSKALFGHREGRINFWTSQAIRILIAVVLITGMVSIWFNNPTQLGQAAAFITAGLAIASQRVITAVSGYLIVLRGKTFNVGDRIMMGGVRGDVISLGFMQTTIMEMGEPPGEQGDAPSMWVASRQYTGRIVTVTNDKIFDLPIYNYTREFPYIWEEMRIPIPYTADFSRAEQIVLESVRRHTKKISELGEDALNELERRYVVKRADLEPRVFYRLTDNWIEMAARFLVEDHGIRAVKDQISRDMLAQLNEAKIGIASGTYEVVGMPELKVRIASGNPPPAGGNPS